MAFIVYCPPVSLFYAFHVSRLYRPHFSYLPIHSNMDTTPYRMCTTCCQTKPADHFRHRHTMVLVTTCFSYRDNRFEVLHFHILFSPVVKLTVCFLRFVKIWWWRTWLILFNCSNNNNNNNKQQRQVFPYRPLLPHPLRLDICHAEISVDNPSRTRTDKGQDYSKDATPPETKWLPASFTSSSSFRSSS